MTKSVTVEQRGIAGDHRYVVAEVDITSLDSAGTEPLDPSSEFQLEDVHGAAVLDQEDYTKLFHFNADAATPAIIVKEVNDTGDGTGGVQDVANNTDVGTVTLKFEGDWSA
jgi:hypothetical protein